MSSARGPKGPWNPIELDLLIRQDWDNRKRVIFLAAVACCPNSYGVYNYSLFNYYGIANCLQWYLQPNAIPSTSDHQVISIELRDVQEVFARLVSDGTLRLYGEHTVWIRDRWAFTGSITHPNHIKGAREYIQTAFPQVWPDFASHYGIASESDTDGMGIIEREIEIENKNTSPAPATHDDLTVEIHDILNTIKGWSKSLDEDAEKVLEIRKVHGFSPEFIRIQAIKLRDWMANKGEKSKNDYGRLNNWMSNAAKDYDEFRKANAASAPAADLGTVKWDND